MDHHTELVLSAHDKSRNNRTALEQAQTAACYACCHVFPSHKVIDFGSDGETPACPLCGVDAVLACPPGSGIDANILAAMNEHWFHTQVPWQLREKTASYFAELV